MIAIEQAADSKFDGDVMLVSDHINGLGDNPLIGPHDPQPGTRFVDMSGVYAASLMRHAANRAATLGLTVTQGVYCSTKANVDAPVAASGLGIVPEAILAAQAGVPIVGLVTPPGMAGDEESNSRTIRLLLGLAGELVETGNGADTPGQTTLL